jgi:hypothetical protein
MIDYCGEGDLAEHGVVVSPDLADKDSIREGVKAAKPYMTANICIGTHCHLLWASNHEAGCQLLHTYLLDSDPDMFRTYSTYLNSKGIFLTTAKILQGFPALPKFAYFPP